MRRVLFFGGLALCVFSCTDASNKNAMQKDTVVMVNPTTTTGSSRDSANAGSAINGGTNSGGATNMNSSGTTTTGADTGTGHNH